MQQPQEDLYDKAHTRGDEIYDGSQKTWAAIGSSFIPNNATRGRAATSVSEIFRKAPMLTRAAVFLSESCWSMHRMSTKMRCHGRQAIRRKQYKKRPTAMQMQESRLRTSSEELWV